MAVIDEGWIVLLYIALLIGAVCAVGFGLMMVITYFDGKRALERDKRFNEEWAYFDKHGEWPEVEYREPGRISKFFSGLGNFIVLAFQIVRVKKWKICPMVDVPR